MTKELTQEDRFKLFNLGLQNKLAHFLHMVFLTLNPSEKYLHNWHIDAMCEYLHAVHRGDIKRLIINIPPRYMKSLICSIAFPAWVMGNNPTQKFIVGSYKQELSEKLSMDCRQIMQSDWFKTAFPLCEIAKDQNQKKKFQTTKQGHRIATSPTGGITGEGADYIIVDDPQNPKEAASDVERIRAINWFQQTLISRLNNAKEGRILLIMQRLHEDDLTGELLKKDFGYEHLDLQIMATRPQHIMIGSFDKHVKEHEILHEARHGEKEIEQMRKEMGEYAFAGQYLQNPAPIGGGVFKQEWLRYYDLPAQQDDLRDFLSTMNIYILCDPAHEQKKTSDYSAIMVVGANYDNNIYLIDIFRDRYTATERIDKLFEIHRKYNAFCGKPPTVSYEINGHRSDQHFIAERMREQRYYFNLINVNHTMRKQDRIMQLQPYFQTGRIYLPSCGIIKNNRDGDRQNLLEIMIEKELLLFPYGIHPDMIDALAQICDEEINMYFPQSPTPAAVLLNGSTEDLRFDYKPKGLDWLDL